MKSKELELDKLNTEMAAFRSRAEEAEQIMTELDQKITELNKEIENQSHFTGIGEENPEERDQRLTTLGILSTELKTRLAQKAIQEKLNAAQIEQGNPSLNRISLLSSDIQMMQAKLVFRQSDRVRLSKVRSINKNILYFDSKLL